MADPTPTRAEVEAECRWLLSRLGNRTTETHLEECTVPMLLALRERAEAAEAERDRQYDENVHRIAMQARAENERDAARRAEAAAWNDAVEAAARAANSDGESEWFNAVHAIRALRRDTPTEGEA